MNTSLSPVPYSGLQVMRRLMGYTRRYWRFFLFGVIGFGINASAESGAVDMVKHITNALAAHDRTAQYWIPPAIILLVLARGVGSFMGNYFISLVARNVVYAMRTQMFDKLLRLPAAYYHLNSPARIAAKLMYDVEQVTGAATDAVVTLAREGLLVFAYMAYLFWLNWRLSILILLIGPVIGKVVQMASMRFRQLSQRIQASMGDLNHVSSETINGYTVVKTFGGEAYERQRFQSASLEYLNQTMKMVVASSINTPVVQMIIVLPMAAVAWLALGPGSTGFHTPGDFIAYFTAAGLLAKPVRALTDVNQKVQKGIAASQSVFALLDLPEEVDKGLLDVDRVTGAVEFRQVNFSYAEGTEEVLRDVSFRIEPGWTVAIVGRSGAGKSSLVNLLSRFYEVDSGEILIDGVPLPQFRLTSLRRQIATVSQKVMLFNDSVQHNIAYGAYAQCSREALEAATRAAYAHDFIMALPQGYKTAIGQDGVQLSGGQRQRLAIARAILKNAPILILDEATSALDNESEYFIQKALDEIMKGRTTFVIAHRLSTIENADIIMVMDRGRLVEMGNHQQLLARNGLYAQLHSRHFEEEPSGETS